MVTRDEVLAHCRAIVLATDLPISADLEKGFGDTPEVVSETIRLAAGIGLAEASIGDVTGDFTLTARSENNPRVIVISTT